MILLDLVLPTENGMMVFQRLKATTFLRGLPIIILTAEDPPVAKWQLIKGDNR